MNIDNKVPWQPDYSSDTTLITTDISASQEEISEVLSSEEDNVPKTLFNKHRRYTHENAYKKIVDQLRSNISKLNLKLKEKTLQHENSKSEYINKIEEIQTNLNKIFCENELLKVQLQVEREENKIMKNNMEAKLNFIESKQGQLQVTSHEIQKIFVNSSQLSETQYKNLKALDKELSLADFISVKLYEKNQEWSSMIESLKLKISYKDKELHSLKIAYDQLKDDVEHERRQNVELELKLERSKKCYEELVQQEHLKSFKIDNYDTLQKEKEELEMQYNDVLKRMSSLSINYEKIVQDKDEHFSELSSAKQSVLLLKHDKEYLTKVLNEQEGKLLAAEGKISQLEQLMSKVKQAREDIYEKYMAAREQYRTEYDEKLKKELGQMKMQMDLEIESLRANIKEVSEREARGLVESRDMALNERDRALMAEREVAAKYEQLLLEHQHLSDGSTISELNNQLKINRFEFEKIQLLYKESLKSIKESQMSYEKLQRKMEILLKEYYSLQTSSEKKVAELEGKVHEQCLELEFVEKYTSDLESFIKHKDRAKSQVAAKDSKDGAPGGDVDIKKNTKERLMACVDLIRKIVLMNKNESLHNIKNSINKDKLTALEQSNKLTAELESQVSMLKKEFASSQLKLRSLQKENSKLIASNEQMSLDMKKLLDQEEEMAAMRKFIKNIKKKPHISRRDLHNSAISPKAVENKLQNE